jgi:hypothetical protein
MIAPVLVPAMSSKSFSVQCPARRALDLAEDLDAEDTADASAVQRQELSRENLATVAKSLRRGGYAPRSPSTHGPLRRSAAYSVGNWEPIAQGREPLGSEGIVPVLRDVRLHAGERTVGWRGTLAHSGAQYLFGEPHAELLGSPLCSHVGQLTVRRSAPDRGQASLSVYARCPRRGPQPLRSQSRAAALASGTVGAFGPPSPLPLTLCVSELATLTDGLLAPYL